MSDEVTVGDARAPEPGSTVGPWVILESLGAGSYGLVYRVRRAGHPEAPPLALKMARSPRDARFEREVAAHKALGGVTSHVPRLEDVGLWTGPTGHRYPYFVMELVEGLSLYEWAQAQRRSSRDVLRVLAQVASALAAAHARGIVHRDAKGDNIRVREDGLAVLLDWGACWLPEARPLTDTTAPPGTTAYRPPEQKAFMWTFRRDPEARWQSTPTDDLYAVGVTLYRLVTGVYLPPCTEGGEPVEREVTPPRELATVCMELETLILRLLSEEREARGTSEQLAREAQVLADTAGPEADKPILPKVHLVEMDESSGLSDSDPAEIRSSASPGVRSLAWSGWPAVAGALAVALILMGAFELHRAYQPPPPAPWLATPEEIAQFHEAAPLEALDGGVGHEALTSVQDAPKATVPLTPSFGRTMPKTPMNGQRRPPCDRGEVAIYGACWVWVGGEKPPCGESMFDHEDRCYKASIDMPRQPTSEEP